MPYLHATLLDFDPLPMYNSKRHLDSDQTSESDVTSMAMTGFESDENLTLRRIGSDDLESFLGLVSDVESIVFPAGTWKPYDEEHLRKLLDEDVAYGIGLYDNDRLVGTAFLVNPGHTLLSGSHQLRLCGLPDKGTAEMTHIMLDGDWRGEGLANGMVDELIKVAVSTRGIRRVYALVHPKNKQSRKLFERSLFITCCGARIPDDQEMFVYQRWFEDTSSKS